MTKTIDFGTAVKKDGRFLEHRDFSDALGDSDSGTAQVDNWIDFEVQTTDGETTTLLVEYVLTVSGYFTYCPGDYWTPPDSDFELTDANVELTSYIIGESDQHIPGMCMMDDVVQDLIERVIGI